MHELSCLVEVVESESMRLIYRYRSQRMNRFGISLGSSGDVMFSYTQSDSTTYHFRNVGEIKNTEMMTIRMIAPAADMAGMTGHGTGMGVGVASKQ